MDPPPRYVMLDNNGMHPPPHQRNIPRYHNLDHSRRCSCMRFFCCCYCCIFILVLLVLAATGFIFFILDPKVPTYRVQNFNIKNFDIQNGNKLYTEFIVVVKTENPNKGIALEYGKDSEVNITYSDSQLGTGLIPQFRQPAQNTTVVDVVMKGHSDFNSQTQHELRENQKQGKIPLKIKARVPLTIVIHGHSLREFKVIVSGEVVVDNFQPGSKVNIISSNYGYIDLES